MHGISQPTLSSEEKSMHMEIDRILGIEDASLEIDASNSFPSEFTSYVSKYSQSTVNTLPPTNEDVSRREGAGNSTSENFTSLVSPYQNNHNGSSQNVANFVSIKDMKNNLSENVTSFVSRYQDTGHSSSQSIASFVAPEQGGGNGSSQNVTSYAPQYQDTINSSTQNSNNTSRQYQKYEGGSSQKRFTKLVQELKSKNNNVQFQTRQRVKSHMKPSFGTYDEEFKQKMEDMLRAPRKRGAESCESYKFSKKFATESYDSLNSSKKLDRDYEKYKPATSRDTEKAHHYERQRLMEKIQLAETLKYSRKELRDSKSLFIRSNFLSAPNSPPDILHTSLSSLSSSQSKISKFPISSSPTQLETDSLPSRSSSSASQFDADLPLSSSWKIPSQASQSVTSTSTMSRFSDNSSDSGYTETERARQKRRLERENSLKFRRLRKLLPANEMDELISSLESRVSANGNKNHRHESKSVKMTITGVPIDNTPNNINPSASSFTGEVPSINMMNRLNGESEIVSSRKRNKNPNIPIKQVESRLLSSRGIKMQLKKKTTSLGLSNSGSFNVIKLSHDSPPKRKQRFRKSVNPNNKVQLKSMNKQDSHSLNYTDVPDLPSLGLVSSNGHGEQNDNHALQGSERDLKIANRQSEQNSVSNNDRLIQRKFSPDHQNVDILNIPTTSATNLDNSKSINNLEITAENPHSINKDSSKIDEFLNEVMHNPTDHQLNSECNRENKENVNNISQTAIPATCLIPESYAESSGECFLDEGAILKEPDIPSSVRYIVEDCATTSGSKSDQIYTLDSVMNGQASNNLPEIQIADNLKVSLVDIPSSSGMFDLRSTQDHVEGRFKSDR